MFCLAADLHELAPPRGEAVHSISQSALIVWTTAKQHVFQSAGSAAHRSKWSRALQPPVPLARGPCQVAGRRHMDLLLGVSSAV